MADAAVRVERSGRVAEVVLARPDRRNALDYAGVAEVVAALARCEADDDVGCVLVRGDGPSFCAGGDLSEFQRAIGASAYDFHVGGEPWVELMSSMRRMGTPVVAAVHGHALAGGCGMVAAADVAVAAEGTVFGTSEITIGLFPIVVYPTLARAIGTRAARELALTGRRVDAQEALRLGLVQRVEAADELLTSARETAARLASYGHHALALGKWFMAEVDDLPVDGATRFAQSIRGSFMTTPDFAEGVAAFLEKRSPRFNG